MRWLGFDWDEGPEVGGPHGPYRQSERFEIYRDVAAKLLDGGRAYHCYCTADELEERNAKARAEGRTPGYDGHCRVAHRRAARGVRSRGPQARRALPDARQPDHLRRPRARGDHVPRRRTCRTTSWCAATAHPLYTLVNPVDDALMEITHVLRGEDLLSSTPRQIALYDALAEVGVVQGPTPQFGHLPYVMGQGNSKLSKRDPESNLLGYREQRLPARGAAQLPRAARLGDLRRPRHLLDGGDGRRLRDRSRQPQPGALRPQEVRGDQRHAPPGAGARVTSRSGWCPFLQTAGLIEGEPTPAQRDLLAAATPLVQERMVTLGESRRHARLPLRR